MTAGAERVSIEEKGFRDRRQSREGRATSDGGGAERVSIKERASEIEGKVVKVGTSDSQSGTSFNLDSVNFVDSV